MRKLGKIALKFIVFNTERRKMNILLENHAMDGGKYTRKNTYQEKFIWPGNMKKCTVPVAVKERGVRMACSSLQYNCAEIPKE